MGFSKIFNTIGLSKTQSNAGIINMSTQISGFFKDFVQRARAATFIMPIHIGPLLDTLVWPNKVKTLIRDEKLQFLGTLTDGLYSKKTWKTLKGFGAGGSENVPDLQHVTVDQLNHHFRKVPNFGPSTVSSAVDEILARPRPLSSFSLNRMMVKSTAIGVDDISITLIRHSPPDSRPTYSYN